MRILIVSNSFFPVNSPRSFRTTELAKEFSIQGHQVTVYVPIYNYNYSVFLSKYINVSLKESVTFERREIKIFGKRFDYLFNLFLTVFIHYPHIMLYFKLPKILKQEKNFDLLISIAYPHPIHWGIKRAIMKNPDLAKTWVADCGDPFMLGGSQKPFYFKWMEKSFCKRADFITIPVEAAKNGYYKEFHDKIRIIPQAFNFDTIKTARYKPNSVITFAYAGRFVPKDLDPRPILDFLISLDIDFLFIIFTNQKELFNNYLSTLNNKLILRDFLDRDTLIHELSKMDFLLYLECNDPVRKPSKLIDYTLTTRPILSINSVKIDKILFKEFLNRNYSRRTIININDSDIKNATAKFLKLCESNK